MILDLLGRLLPGLFRTLTPTVSNFSWLQLLPGFGSEDHLAKSFGLHDQHALLVMGTSWLVVIAVLGFALVARGQLQTALERSGVEKYTADADLSARTAAEVLVSGVLGMITGTLSHKDAEKYFPFLATIFTYILASNLVGFIPGLVPPTESVSTNVAVAVSVFLVFNISGLMRNGTGYIKHLAGPKLALWLFPVTVLVFAIELFGLVLRPATLTIRLSANIFADHLVASVMRGLGESLPVVGAIGAVVLPLPFYFLGLLVCFLQAFVFTLLSTIYIGLAVAHDDGHH